MERRRGKEGGEERKAVGCGDSGDGEGRRELMKEGRKEGRK